MAKVTVQQLEDAGFRAAQFGTPADWQQATTGYLARVIAAGEAWVKAEVGDALYATTTGLVGYALAQAELCWSRAELWRRRAAFLDSNAFTAMEASAASERRTYMVQADDAMTCARDWIASVKAGEATQAGSGVVLAYVETGPYAEASS